MAPVVLLTSHRPASTTQQLIASQRRVEIATRQCPTDHPGRLRLTGLRHEQQLVKQPAVKLQLRQQPYPMVSCSRDAAGFSGPGLPAPDDASVHLPPRLKLPAPVVSRFPVHIHPEYESVKSGCDQWTLSLFDPSPSHAVSRAYLDGLYPLLIASCFPSTAIPRERLVLIIKLNNWLFLLDDTVDELGEDQATELMDGVVTLLETPGGPFEYRTSNRLFRRFLERFRIEVMQDICADMPPGVRDRFLREMAGSLGAMQEIWQLRSRERKTGRAGLATVEDMVALRGLDAFGVPFLIVLEYALGMELPDAAGQETAMGRLVQKMKRSAARHLSLVNDMMSYAKEIKMMDAQSVVGCLARRRREDAGGPLTQQAMEAILAETWDMIVTEERHCAHQLSQIRSLAKSLAHGHGDQLVDLAAHQSCVSYAENICHLLSGNLYWSTQTWRYHGRHSLPWNKPHAFLVTPPEPLTPLNIFSSRKDQS